MSKTLGVKNYEIESDAALVIRPKRAAKGEKGKKVVGENCLHLTFIHEKIPPTLRMTGLS